MLHFLISSVYSAGSLDSGLNIGAFSSSGNDPNFLGGFSASTMRTASNGLNSSVLVPNLDREVFGGMNVAYSGRATRIKVAKIDIYISEESFKTFGHGNIVNTIESLIQMIENHFSENEVMKGNGMKFKFDITVINPDAITISEVNICNKTPDENRQVLLKFSANEPNHSRIVISHCPSEAYKPLFDSHRQAVAYFDVMFSGKCEYSIMVFGGSSREELLLSLATALARIVGARVSDPVRIGVQHLGDRGIRYTVDLTDEATREILNSFCYVETIAVTEGL